MFGKRNSIHISAEKILLEYLSDKSELTENNLGSSSHGDYMLNSKYVKYLVFPGLLGLFATMFVAIGDFQNHAFAQITPAPEKYGGSSGDQSSSNSRDDDGGSNNSDSSESSSSNDDSESQETGSSEEEQDTDSDSGESNPLMEKIINKVKHDFAAVGLPSLDW